MTFINDGFYSAFQKARAVQGRIRRQIQIETGTADWKTLREWSRLLRRNAQGCSPERMRTLVMRHDPAIELETLVDARIVGKGGGDFNLNAYRCGRRHGVAVFEKIYLLDSDSWRKLNWVYTFVLPRLEGRVRTPRLLHRVEGRRLAAAYFEYIPDMSRNSKAATLTAAKEFRRCIYDVDMSRMDPTFADFRSEPIFVRGIDRLENILIRQGRDPGAARTLADAFLAPGIHRVFTHGDLVPENIAPDGKIIDWDRCGAYPEGYDFGRTIGLLIYCKSLVDFDAFITKNIAGMCPRSSGSLEFFSAVFYARRNKTGVQVTDAFILDLFDRACALQGSGEKVRHSA
ncbi:MAG: phosphotransferase [Nioella sp.]